LKKSGGVKGMEIKLWSRISKSHHESKNLQSNNNKFSRKCQKNDLGDFN